MSGQGAGLTSPLLAGSGTSSPCAPADPSHKADCAGGDHGHLSAMSALANGSWVRLGGWRARY